MTDIVQGSRVVFREDQLKYFQTAFAARLTNREGIVESVYTPIGMSRNPPTRVRVRWLKRGNRGKEFIETHYVNDIRLADGK
jgi:hypothetical protein